MAKIIDAGKVTGLSAYEIAVEQGYIGTKKEWIASLKGEKGEKGDQGDQGIQGIQGIQGERGESGVYIGSGDMPDDANVQIDPKGDAPELATKEEVEAKQDQLTDAQILAANSGITAEQLAEIKNFTDKFFVSGLVLNETTNQMEGSELDIANAWEAMDYYTKTLLVHSSTGAPLYIPTTSYCTDTYSFSFVYKNKIYTVTIDRNTETLSTTYIDLNALGDISKLSCGDATDIVSAINYLYQLINK